MAREIRAVAAVGPAHDGMHRELEDGSERLAVVDPIKTQQADLRIDWPHRSDLVVEGQRVGMPDISFLAALQLESPVFHDRILAPRACPGPDRDPAFPGLRDGADRAGGDVRGNEGVAMTRVHHERVRGNAGILLQRGANLGKKRITDRPDLGDGDGIDRDDHRVRSALRQHERLHHRRIFLHRMIGVGDLDLRDSGEKRLGFGIGRTQQGHDHNQEG